MTKTKTPEQLQAEATELAERQGAVLTELTRTSGSRPHVGQRQSEPSSSSWSPATPVANSTLKWRARDARWTSGSRPTRRCQECGAGTYNGTPATHDTPQPEASTGLLG